jgi:hypothetical protein
MLAGNHVSQKTAHAASKLQQQLALSRIGDSRRRSNRNFSGDAGWKSGQRFLLPAKYDEAGRIDPRARSLSTSQFPPGFCHARRFPRRNGSEGFSWQVTIISNQIQRLKCVMDICAVNWIFDRAAAGMLGGSRRCRDRRDAFANVSTRSSTRWAAAISPENLLSLPRLCGALALNCHCVRSLWSMIAFGKLARTIRIIARTRCQLLG